MLQNEATAALREVLVTLYDVGGARKTGITGATIKIRKPGGNLVAAAAADVTELTGADTAHGGGGDYVFSLSAGEVDTVGLLAYEVTKSDGSIQAETGYVPIRPAIRAADVGSGVIAAGTFAAGAINAAAIAANAIGASALAAGAITATTFAANAINAAALASDAGTEIAAAVLAGVVDGTRTVKGVLARLNAITRGKATGLLSNVATFFLEDNVTKAVEFTQDTGAGTRVQASTTAGD